jgi:molybdopterin-guanine dinucleotide biosynthesis protein B
MRNIKGMGIVGYKKSGKTMLIEKITEELRKREINDITIIKHSEHNISLENKTDTERVFKNSSKVIGLFGDSSILLSKSKEKYNDIIRTLNTKILIVEGFKSVKNIPRIICIKDEKEIDELSNGLEIGYFSLEKTDSKKHKIWGIEDIKEITDAILEKGFVLPNINCGKCNERTCFEFGEKLIKKETDIYRCSYIKDREPINITINNEELVLNKFTADALKNIITAYLKTLKGIGEGPVEIKFEL